MLSEPTYQAAVAAYTQALQELFAPPPAPVRGRPAHFVPADELAARADRLAAAAAMLSQETSGYLSAEDLDQRVGAEQHLLAQATANLQVADGLLAAAAAAGEVAATEGTRSPAAPQAVFEPLVALLATPLDEVGAMARSLPASTRSQRATATPAELVAAANLAIEAILDGVASYGRDVLAGMVGLDTALLKQAAGIISQELSELVAKLGEEGSKLLAKAVTFIVQAYDNLLAALGQDTTSEMRRRAAELLQRLQQGEVIESVLRTLFEVPKAEQRIRALVEASQAAPAVLGQISVGVAALPAGFAARTKLANQLLAALGVLKHVRAVQLPLVELARAALYVALLGFVLYVGGDYVDAPRLERLGRVPGVVQVVANGLA